VELQVPTWVHSDVAESNLTADFTRTDVDRQLDLSDLSALAAETFDLLSACDVLEHVPDDHRAMREIHRVLRRGGYAILTVPQQDGLAETFEDATITATKL
jgi:ubiquinone/menaquinone biosynthesis C-methylase UbiE